MCCNFLGKILPKIQGVLHLQRLESGVEQLETRVVAPIDTCQKMCISVYIIIDIDLFTYIVYIYTFVVYMFNMYIYIHLHIYLFLYLNMHMLFCERSCLFHFNSSFFPSLHPSIHPRAVKCDKHACMTDKYKKSLPGPSKGCQMDGKGCH